MNDTQQATQVWTVPGWDEELRCESLHQDPHNPKTACTQEVVALAWTCCVADLPICQSNYNFRMERILSNTSICAECTGWIADCWTVRPI